MGGAQPSGGGKSVHQGVCYLLTDIEASTQRWEKFPAAMAAAAARHDAIVVSQIRAFGGTVHDQAGDGALAIFPSGSDPLGCAIAIERQIEGEDWADVGGLCVRIAVHADDGAHAGVDRAAINRTARMAASAWGGQIVVSAAARARVRAPAAVRFEDLGLCWLKDLETPMQLYGLQHPHLGKQHFPPLRLSGAGLLNAPQQTTPLFGRDADLAKLLSLVEDSGAPVVTIVGVGGIGKTRLGAHLGLVLASRRRAHFVSLEHMRASDDLASELGRALRFPFHGVAPRQDQLLDYLRDKDMVLVLDGAEHALASAKYIERLAHACAHLTIIATSREPLKIDGEVLFRLGGLGGRPGAAPAGEDPARALFLAAARQSRADFGIAADEEGIFADILRLLGGSPLALQLCAQWVGYLSLAAMRQRLSRDLDLLRRIDGAHARHRSIDSVLQGSWALLAPSQRAALEALSVFETSFDLDGANAVAQLEAEDLHALEARGLLESAGQRRFGLHPLVQSYAAQRRDGGGAAAAARHRRYYLSLFARLMQAGDPVRQAAALAEIETELANIQTAWAGAVKHEPDSALITLAERLFFFFVLRGRYAEGEKMFSVACAAPALQGHLDALLANCLVQQGRAEAARAALQRAEAADLEPLARAHVRQAYAKIAHLCGDYAEAAACYRAAYALRADLGDTLGLSFTAGSWALALMRAGELEAARPLIKEADDLYQASANTAGMMVGHGVAGDLAMADGDLLLAQTRYRQGLELEAVLANPHLRVGLLLRAGNLAMRSGDLAAAAGHFQAAQATAEDLGDEALLARALNQMGACLRRSGELAMARTTFVRTLRLSRALSLRHEAAAAVLGLAHTEYERGDKTAAARALAVLEAPPQSAGADEYAELSRALGPMVVRVDQSFETQLAELLDLHAAGP